MKYTKYDLFNMINEVHINKHIKERLKENWQKYDGIKLASIYYDPYIPGFYLICDDDRLTKNRIKVDIQYIDLRLFYDINFLEDDFYNSQYNYIIKQMEKLEKQIQKQLNSGVGIKYIMDIYNSENKTEGKVYIDYGRERMEGRLQLIDKSIF